jgi:hypothetical protein
MFLQGNLQVVFDALYSLGVIDPVLEKDWKQSYEEFDAHESKVHQAVASVNSCSGDLDKIVDSLKAFDMKTLEYVAMEVAREFADFYARKVTH